MVWYSTREVVTWHIFTLWCWCDGHTFSWDSLFVALHSIFFAARGFPIYQSCQYFILFYSKVLLFPTFPLLGFLLSQNKIRIFIQSRVCFHLLGIELMCHMINVTKYWKVKKKKKLFHGPISASNWCFFLITPIFKQIGKNAWIMFPFREPPIVSSLRRDIAV